MNPTSLLRRLLIPALLLALLSGCSYSATVHRYGGPSLEAKIVASDLSTLLVQDEHGETYEVPVLTVTEIDHPGTGWLIAGGVLAGLGALFALSFRENDGDVIGGTYIGMGLGVGLIGAVPYIRSRMNASGAELRAGQRLVPSSDLPVRRIHKQRPPLGPKVRP
jgi:hypothetical protein